ncbi:HAD family hydrolase [Paralimibaculum aggregatum]|uniref:phosphoglycolate phosphatase n=1 Tax=Paralimibaculum aggregatum TaxID=3036245 RepID=A0ABQ6LPX2_9RHOB|nr:HAD family hydrolase [Limibaculum sp. NKW23]GMG83902.1 HAD family hydrolase [Limibaculum sp. NKW23]
MTAPAIRALLFDKDGTLFDFHATWSAVVTRVIDALAPDETARRAMAASGGIDLVTGRFEPGSPIVAGAVQETALLWEPLVPGLDAAAIEERINTLSAAMTGPATLVPAAADLPGLLAELRAAGLALGVATHDSEGAARAQLAAIGALEAFDFIAGYDSGHGLKPGPGMLLAFAAATGRRPDEIAMIGDSVHDLMVAPNAGAAMAIGVLTGPAGPADLAPHATHVIGSIAELPALLRL